MDAYEEKLYEAVALEVAEKRMKPGLYAKAFSDAMGDKDRTLAIYIKLRVEDLHRELVALEVQDPRCVCTHRNSQHSQSPKGRGFTPCSQCPCYTFMKA
jgi:hypothetical protein